MSDEEEPGTEAEEYFSALDQTIPGLIVCDNCGYPMDKNQTWLHNLSKARKCSTEMARRMAMTPSDIPDDEWKLMEEYNQRRQREANPLPKAFKVKKPSWIERLLQKLR